MLDLETPLERINALAVVRHKGMASVLTLRIEHDTVKSADFTKWDKPEVTLQKAVQLIARSARTS